MAGRLLFVEAADDWSAQAISKLFAGWFLTPQTDIPLSSSWSLRISSTSKVPAIPDGLNHFNLGQGGCFTDGETFHLLIDGSLIKIGPKPDSDIDIWVQKRYSFESKILAQIISQGVSIALRRLGLFELHSSGVVAPGHVKATLIIGPSGAGKSTLTSQLAACGWSYLSDDAILLRKGEHGIDAWGIRRFFALTANTMASMGLTPRGAETGGNFKSRMSPLNMFPGAQVQCAQPGTLLFPTITLDAESRLQRITPAEAMATLIRLCPWASYYTPTAERYLSLLNELARTAVAFQLFAGMDLLGNPERTSHLLDLCARN